MDTSFLLLYCGLAETVNSCSWLPWFNENCGLLLELKQISVFRIYNYLKATSWFHIVWLNTKHQLNCTYISVEVHFCLFYFQTVMIVCHFVCWILSTHVHYMFTSIISVLTLLVILQWYNAGKGYNQSTKEWSESVHCCCSPRTVYWLRTRFHWLMRIWNCRSFYKMVSKPVFGLYIKSSKGCLHQCELNSVLNVNPVICIKFDSSTSICNAYSFINLNMSLVQG